MPEQIIVNITPPDLRGFNFDSYRVSAMREWAQAKPVQVTINKTDDVPAWWWRKVG